MQRTPLIAGFFVFMRVGEGVERVPDTPKPPCHRQTSPKGVYGIG